MIIIEGPDGVGKTHFARELAKYYGIEIKHLPQPTPDFNFFEEYKELIKNNDDVIFDRFFYSELVYGPVKRGYTGLSKVQVEILEDMLYEKRATVFFLHARAEALQIRCSNKGEDFVRGPEIPVICVKYAEVFSKSKLPVIRMDTTKFFPLAIK